MLTLRGLEVLEYGGRLQPVLIQTGQRVPGDTEEADRCLDWQQYLGLSLGLVLEWVGILPPPLRLEW